MIVDPTSVSYEKIKAELTAYVDSKPDNAKWKDLFSSEIGTTIVELLAGFMAYFSYTNISARRETFLHYAQNKSSVIANAQALGYSSYRGRNITMTLNIVPNTTQVLSKYSLVGTCKDFDIVLLEDAILNEGEAINISVVIGNFNTESQMINTSNLEIFRFINKGVSEDYRLFLNTDEVETSGDILDLSNDKYVVISNALESVDVAYLNNSSDASMKYKTGDVLTIQYIKKADVEYDPDDLILDIGTISSFEDIVQTKDTEATDSIKINASLHHETVNLIRGREDFKKLLPLIELGISDTAYRDASAAHVEVTYIKNDLTIFTDDEMKKVFDTLNAHRPFGIPEGLITNPICAKVKLDIALSLISSSVAITTIDSDLKSILEKYSRKLGGMIDLSLIEHDINNLSYVKICRVNIDTSTWEPDTHYTLGKYVYPTVKNGKKYKVIDFVEVAGTEEPNWSTELNSNTYGENIIWKCFKNNGSAINNWSPGERYRLNEVVLPVTANGYMYKCVGYRMNSGVESPEWPLEINETVYDNELLWLCRNKTDLAEDWIPSTIYSLGDIVNISSIEDRSYQCIGFVSKTDNTEPIWTLDDGESTFDGNIEYSCEDDDFSDIVFKWNEYFDIEKNVTIEK